jgi:hypothetical protein
MFFETRQWSIVLMLSLCSAVTLFAEQRVRVEDVARLQAQAEMERQELQIQMERVQRENRHVVKAPAVNALELRRAEAQAEKALQVPSGKNNPRSPEETAKVQVALQEFNEQLPELNRALKQASSNSAVPMIVLSPMTAEGVFSAAEKEEVPASANQLAANQIVLKRMQQEMAKADPETRRQIKNVLAMMAEGKELSQPKNLPLPLRSQLVPKGAP